MDPFVLALIIAVPLMAVFIWISMKRVRKSGYEELSNPFYMKEGKVYFVKNLDFTSAKLIEIIGISEIRRDTRLTSLAVRYRIDNVVKEQRVMNTPSKLLTMEDRLGFGG